jgi:hypothetical protein
MSLKNPRTNLKMEELLLPSHEEVNTLYSLAAQIKAVAPWSSMQETDIFGVEDPDSGEIGFVSVMGNLGEFESVAVYRGAEGLFGFIDFQMDPSASADRLLEIPEVQLSFTEPKFLEKLDRELLKASALKFTGTRPQFRSYRPGYFPWFITLREARLVIHALTQTVEMTRRLVQAPFLFPGDVESAGDSEDETLLVRVPLRQNPSREEDPSAGEDYSSKIDSPPETKNVLQPSSASDFVWEDKIKRISRPNYPPIDISIDTSLLKKLAGLRPSAMQLEADLFIAPGRIGKPNERPLAMYILLLADRFSGFILGFEALTAESTLNKMYGSIPERVAALLWKNKALPKQIIARSELLLDLLEPLEEELKIQLRRANELPAIDEATASLVQFLQTGKI